MLCNIILLILVDGLSCYGIKARCHSLLSSYLNNRPQIVGFVGKATTRPNPILFDS